MLPRVSVSHTYIDAGGKPSLPCTPMVHAVRARAYHGRMDLLDAPVATTEFIVVDTETNGLSGDDCEMTEIGAVLVGGGELHDRFSSLVRTSAPLRRGIQRFTGITQAMVDGAPSLEAVLPTLETMVRGRVLVAHNAPFDRRVLRQAFARIGLDWPDPPVICTAALARAVLPLQRQRGLGVLADALGIEVQQAHRALADAETCARVLCALFPRLCANAASVADALALLAPRRRSRRPAAPPESAPGRGHPAAELPEFAELPRDPGVYLFRDDTGRVLYVGKSVSIRARARAHFAPSTAPAGWTAHAAVVDYRVTRSELAALVLENRLIKELRPPGNKRLTARDDRLVYIRCRLDIAFPILEVARDPARGMRSRSGPCADDAWRWSSWSSSTLCSACVTAGGACPAGNTPPPMARWGAACRRASATLTPTCTAAGSTRSCACSSAMSPGSQWAGRCYHTWTGRCAPRPPRSSSSARPRSGAGRAGCARSSAGSTACSRPPTSARVWWWPAIPPVPSSTASGWRAAVWSTGARWTTISAGCRSAAPQPSRAPGGSAIWARTCLPMRSTRCGSSAAGSPRIQTRPSWRCDPSPTSKPCGRSSGALQRSNGKLDHDGLDLIRADAHV